MAEVPIDSWLKFLTPIMLLVLAWYQHSNRKQLTVIHMLVNKRYGDALRTIYEQAVFLAESNPTLKNNRAVELAKARLQEHLDQQRAVDTLGAT